MTTPTQKQSETLDVIYVAGRNVYKPNDVFSSNYDGVLLAKDAWECTKYVRAQPSETPVADKVLPDGWELIEKETCYQLHCGNLIVAVLAGPDAQKNASILSALIDQQAVPSPPLFVYQEKQTGEISISPVNPVSLAALLSFVQSIKREEKEAHHDGIYVSDEQHAHNTACDTIIAEIEKMMGAK